jgi:ABC-type oligopeptide transport system substrate-binding subunit
MFAGSNQINISSCSAIKPVSGFDPTRDMHFVRNPNYNQSTDNTRQNFIDGLDYSIDTNITDIFNRITNGSLEGEVASPPAQVLKQYDTTSSLKPRLQVNSGDRTWYISMNLTQPPFDDIHVRKAANWIMDKAALQRAWGGPLRGKIATHIVPNSMFNGALANFDPYKTPGEAGDLAKAQAEMKLSKYDPKKDGKCDVSACKNILFVNRNSPPWTDMEPIIVADFAKIGIQLVPREFQDAYPVIQDATKNVPVTAVPGWGKDYADAGTFMVLFNSASILPQGNVNYSLVGLTPKLAKADNIKGTMSGIPNVDGRIAKCQPLTGSARLTCWENLDKYLMTNVVPWVPYLDATNVDILGPAVTRYRYDQFSGESAYSRDAVDPAKQK